MKRYKKETLIFVIILLIAMFGESIIDLLMKAF